MKSVTHRAHMSPDLAAMENHAFIRRHHVFFQFGFKALPRLDLVDIELLRESDQKCGSVGDGVRGEIPLLILVLIFIQILVLSLGVEGMVAKARTKHPAGTNGAQS